MTSIKDLTLFDAYKAREAVTIKFLPRSYQSCPSRIEAKTPHLEPTYSVIIATSNHLHFPVSKSSRSMVFTWPVTNQRPSYAKQCSTSSEE